MEMFRVISKLGASSLVMALILALSYKYVASVAGPVGIANFGLSREIIRGVVFLLTLSSSAALLQGLCNANYDTNIFIKSALLVLLINFCSITFFYFVFRGLLYDVFEIQNFEKIIPPYIAIGIGLCSTSTIFFVSVLNSRKMIGKMATVQIVSALFFLLPFIIYKTGDNFQYSLPFFSMYLASSLLAAVFVALHEPYIFQDIWRANYSKLYMAHFFKMCSASVLGTLSGVVGILTVKIIILRQSGSVSLGNFEAAYTLIMSYMALLSVGLGAYLIPKFANDDYSRAGSELSNILTKLLLFMFPIYFVLQTCSTLIVQIMYFEDFYVAPMLFEILLIGDIHRVLSTVLGFFLIAKAKYKWTGFLAVLWNILFILNGYFIFWTLPEFSFSISYVVTNVMFYLLNRLVLYFHFNVTISKAVDIMSLLIMILLISNLYYGKTI